MRPNTAGTKKSVGFSLRGTKIDAPSDDPKYQGETTNKFKNMKNDFSVAKAKEYESIYQLPKFSHATGAVINPPPFKIEKTLWQPDSNLQFDGSRLPLNVDRY